MPFVRLLRTAQLTTSTGTGTITLGANVDGFEPFSEGMASTDTTVVAVEAIGANGLATGDWEFFETEFTSPSTLSRGTLIGSSTGSRINFAAGTKRVYGVILSDSVDLASSRLIGSLPVAKVSGAAPAASPTLTGLIATNGSVRQTATAVAALNIDCSLTNSFTKTIAGNSTFTFSNPPASGVFYAFTLKLVHTSGTITWPASVKWPGNTAPTLTTGRTHLLTFFTDDGGTTWFNVPSVNYLV